MGDEGGLVLIVDDIDENLKVLGDTLTQAGFHPLQAKSGERAIQIASRAHPDLILLDIKMPGMDGFETIKRLKADPSTSDIPVMFISALNQIEDKVQGFRSGAVDYVSKPFQKEEVVARVRTHLRLRQAQRNVEREREKSDLLLESILPPGIAAELKETGRSEPRSYPAVSVLFTDLVDFTKQAARLSPRELIDELNDIVGAFDTITREHGCERIKTIGEVVAGIVGTRRYIYDVFGDTVNLASRLESASEPMRVNISSVTAGLLAGHMPCTPRGSIEVKGAGPMEMFWLEDCL